MQQGTFSKCPNPDKSDAAIRRVFCCVEATIEIQCIRLPQIVGEPESMLYN
jgi:hypothetical protein